MREEMAEAIALLGLFLMALMLAAAGYLIYLGLTGQGMKVWSRWEIGESAATVSCWYFTPFEVMRHDFAMTAAEAGIFKCPGTVAIGEASTAMLDGRGAPRSAPPR